MTEAAQAERAWVKGRPVSPAEAVRAAVALLAASRSAVVAGLGTDIAGARASVALAQAIGASIDHMDADAVFTNLDVMRRAGWIVTTPLQTRARADTVLLVGEGLPAGWPDMAERLGLDAPPPLAGGARRVFQLRADPSPRVLAAPTLASSAKSADGEEGPILAALAVLRAFVAGRRHHSTKPPRPRCANWPLPWPRRGSAWRSGPPPRSRHWLSKCCAG